MAFNNPQFAYYWANAVPYYSFLAYDTTTYSPVLFTLNAATGAEVFNVSLPNPPYPFGFQYDTILGQLYAQEWQSNGTAYLVTLNPQTGATSNTGFSFDAGTWWSFVASAYDGYNHTYYALLASAVSESLVAIDSRSGQLSFNLTLGVSLNYTLNAYGLQYNNNTDTFYVVGFNGVAQTFDIAWINQKTGSLDYLNIFNNNSTFNGDVTGMGLDNINNILSIVYTNGTDFVVANVDLSSNSIMGTPPTTSPTLFAVSDILIQE